MEPPHQSLPSDQTPRFGRYAARYEAYRPAYPDAVFDRLVAAAGAPLTHAVDLGAGTGQATKGLLTRFAHVSAVEPDPDMAALLPSHPRLTVHTRPAEAAEFAAGGVDCVLAATAFHWMDAELVCARVAGWLRPGGAFMAVAFSRPQAAFGPVGDVLARYNALWRSRMHDRLSDWRAYGDLITESQAFRTVKPFEIYADFTWTPEQTAGFLLSTSYASAYALATGDEEAHQKELVHALAAAAAHDGMIALRLPLEGALAQV